MTGEGLPSPATAWAEGAAAAMQAVHDRIAGPIAEDAFPLPPNPYLPRMRAEMTMTSTEVTLTRTDEKPATPAPRILRTLGMRALDGQWTRLYVWSDGLVTIMGDRPGA